MSWESAPHPPGPASATPLAHVSRIPADACSRAVPPPRPSAGPAARQAEPAAGSRCLLSERVRAPASAPAVCHCARGVRALPVPAPRGSGVSHPAPQPPRLCTGGSRGPAAGFPRGAAARRAAQLRRRRRPGPRQLRGTGRLGRLRSRAASAQSRRWRRPGGLAECTVGRPGPRLGLPLPQLPGCGGGGRRPTWSPRALWWSRREPGAWAWGSGDKRPQRLPRAGGPRKGSRGAVAGAGRAVGAAARGRAWGGAGQGCSAPAEKTALESEA